ncbi:MAG: PAS domain S-box protein [Elusimicrobia bacterium]|nr:PAS domain S-box protein [Elusimicrobiota bacterium]
MTEGGTDTDKDGSTLRNETTLMRVLEQAPISIAIHTMEGKLEFVNRKFTEIFGYLPEDIPTAESWMRQAYPEPGYRKQLNDHQAELMARAVATNGELAGGEYRVVAKNGAAKTVFISGVITPDKKVVSLLDDVTSRVGAEKALRESESLYRALIETTGTGYVVVDGHGKVLDANREYVRLTGHKDLKEIMGRSVLDWTAPAEKEKNAKAVAQCARDGYIWNFEVDYTDKAGNITPIEINATVVSRSGVPQILTLCRDITLRRAHQLEIRRLNEGLEKRVAERTADLTAANTELKAGIAQRAEAEKAREELREELLQAQKMEAVGCLAGGIAHDFGNILAAISGYAEFMLKELPEGAPTRNDLDEILLETERGALLVRQLTAMGRKQPVEHKVLDLNEIAADSCKMLTRIIGPDMRLETRLSPDIDNIKADRGQVSQVIMNLVVNARDAMPDGGKITLETAVEAISGSQPGLRLHPPPGKYVRLSVGDTGCGMTPATLSHIFEPFFTTKEQGKGTGLGLSTVYGIVRQAGGGIDVSTGPGEGTTFRIYFPAGPGAGNLRLKGAYHAEQDTGRSVGPHRLLPVLQRAGDAEIQEKAGRRYRRPAEERLETGAALRQDRQ